MPLPLILVGAAIVAGVGGVAAGASAKGTMDKAKDIADKAKAKLQQAQDRLRWTGDATNRQLAKLGRTKLEASSGTLKRVVAVADRVHVGEDRMKLATVRDITVTPATVDEMKNASFKAQDILGAGAAGLSTGALAGVGALGLATTIGTASTGTAIGTLSGAAATNATLAWLGGGAISAGGLGMAGGMAVTVGIIAGPALAIMGIAAAVKADKSLTEATEYATKVDVAVEKVMTGIAKTRLIDTRAEQVRLTIERLEGRLRPMLQGAEAMLDTKPPGKVAFGDLSETEQALYKTTLAMGAALYQLIEIDIIDELGEVTAASAELMREADRILSSKPEATLSPAMVLS